MGTPTYEEKAEVTVTHTTYIGTKLLTAIAMTLGAYNNYRNFPMVPGEDPEAPGYLVEYLDGGKPNHPSHKGYISWSPKDVFEKHYRPVTGNSFGVAIEALKVGKRVARAGWNGKGMFLFLLPASDSIPTKVIHDPALRQVIETELGGDTFDALGSIRMFTADKKVLTGWLASQTDILSEDWVVL
jgi:hypothetical protein